MKLLKILIATAVVIGAGVWIASSALGPRPNRGQEVLPDKYTYAIYGCKQWTKANSKLAVGEIIDEYEITGQARPGRYLVGIDYRAQGSGLLMEATCEYQESGGQMILIKAESRPKK